MNRNVLFAVLGALLLVLAGFGGYYFAVAVPAQRQAGLQLQQQQLAVKQQQLAAEEAARKAKLAEQRQVAEAKQQAVQAKQNAKDKRSQYLAACQRKADSEYWNYVKLNGEAVAGQPGVYNAPQYVWDRATSAKQARLDECFRLVDSGVNPDDLAGTVVPSDVAEPAPALDSSAAGGHVAFAGFTDADVQGFVRAYLAAGEESDPAAAMNLYAENVGYFGKGVQPKAALYTDKRGYFKRWPTRNYTLASDIATLSETPSTRQVRFDYDYRVERPGKVLFGRAYTILGLEQINDQLHITSEQGEVY